MARTRRLACTLIIGALCAALSTFVPASAAGGDKGGGKQDVPPYFTRTSTYLCTGYIGCKREGYSHFGYRKAGKRMWWRMYSGHNCTNYVAYRMVKGGMSPERPWPGTGMAYNWGRANRGKTDRTPMVGAVAWWDRNTRGVGSSGHVAFVERVVDRRTIVISEDSWSGDFHWRRLTKGSGSWPSGFVHFADRKVEVRTRPSIVGTAAVGERLTARTGRWTQDPRLKVQWLADGEPIPGATGTTLTPTPALRRARLAVRVEARSRGYVTGRATSERTERVARGTYAVAAAPTLSGTARVDKVLELRQARWSPTPGTTAIRWYADGQPIAGATGTSLRLGPALHGRRITVTMTGRGEGYRTSRLTTEATVPVAPGHIRIGDPFTLGGALRMGRRLTVTPGAVTPGDARAAYTWLRNGIPVPGAVGTTYRLGVDDVGKRISVRVDLALEGYRDRAVLLAPDARVTTRPTLATVTSGKPGRAVVKLTVSAPGAATPGGRAIVRIDGQEVAGKVVDGRLRLVVHGLTRGRHDVRVRYLGTEVVRPGRALTTVRIPSKPRD